MIDEDLNTHYDFLSSPSIYDFLISMATNGSNPISSLVLPSREGSIKTF